MDQSVRRLKWKIIVKMFFSTRNVNAIVFCLKQHCDQCSFNFVPETDSVLTG